MGEFLKSAYQVQINKLPDGKLEIVRHEIGEYIPIEVVVAGVVEITGVPEDDLKSSKRDRDIVRARDAAILLIRTMFSDMTLADIGKKFGNRDHSTVIHSLAKAEKLIQEDASFKYMFDEICEELDPEGNLRKRF